MSKFFVSIGNLAALWLIWSVAALVPLGPVAVTHAGVAPIPPRMSRVDATVEDLGGGTFRYTFTVNNTTDPCFGGEISCNMIVNWELPIFAMGDVVDGTITQPDGWEFEIIRLDLDPNASTFYYNNPDGPYGLYRWEWAPRPR